MNSISLDLIVVDLIGVDLTAEDLGTVDKAAVHLAVGILDLFDMYQIGMGLIHPASSLAFVTTCGLCGL